MRLFLGPTKNLVPVAIVLVAALVIALGKVCIGHGTFWTVAGAAGLGGTTAALATRWRALDQLGTSFRAFVRGGVLFSALSADFLTAAAVITGQIRWARNPWYAYYDAFFFTTGPTPYFDTDGAPSITESAGQSAGTIAASIGLTFLLFFAAGIGGIGAGLTDSSRSREILMKTILVVGFFAGLAAAGLVAGIVVASIITLVLAARDIAKTPRSVP